VRRLQHHRQERGREHGALIYDLVDLADRPPATLLAPGAAEHGKHHSGDTSAPIGHHDPASGLDGHPAGNRVVVRVLNRELDSDLDEAVLLHVPLLRRAALPCN
jgi:hypothetical protein